MVQAGKVVFISSRSTCGCGGWKLAGSPFLASRPRFISTMMMVVVTSMMMMMMMTKQIHSVAVSSLLSNAHRSDQMQICLFSRFDKKDLPLISPKGVNGAETQFLFLITAVDEKGKRAIWMRKIFREEKKLASTVVLKMMASAMMMKADAEVNDVNYSSGGGRAIARSPVQSNCQQSHLYRQKENAVELTTQ